jgi:hypothetical protein
MGIVVKPYRSKIVHRQVKWAANPGGQPLTLPFFFDHSQIKLSGQKFELELV